LRCLANAVRNVDCKKVAVRQKPLDGLESDMVGIDVVGFRPMQRFHGFIGGRSSAAWIRAGGYVFAIGFVTDRDDFCRLLGRLDASLKLCPGLMSETIAHAQGVFAER